MLILLEKKQIDKQIPQVLVSYHIYFIILSLNMHTYFMFFLFELKLQPVK